MKQRKMSLKKNEENKIENLEIKKWR